MTPVETAAEAMILSPCHLGKREDAYILADIALDSVRHDHFVMALRDYMLAQSRMLDKWADGNQAVKDRLWKELHSLEDNARQLLSDNATKG